MFEHTKYNFSFTAASLRLPDFVRVAALKREIRTMISCRNSGVGRLPRGAGCCLNITSELLS